MNPTDAVNASAARIMMLRGNEMQRPRSHLCREKDCRPACEIDLLNTGRLPPGSRIIDSRVYVCIYQQVIFFCVLVSAIVTRVWCKVHVCSPDSCREYVDRHDGICPISGLHHGRVDQDQDAGYVPREKRTTRYKPGLSVTKRRRNDEDEEGYGDDNNNNAADGSALVAVKLEPGLPTKSQQQLFRTAPPEPVTIAVKKEEGFISFGAATASASAAEAKPRRLKPETKRKQVSDAHRRDEAEIIVGQLLYSNVRGKLNDAKRVKNRETMLKTLATYYKVTARALGGGGGGGNGTSDARGPAQKGQTGQDVPHHDPGGGDPSSL